MEIVNNKEEFDALYPYKEGTFNIYPKEYPCVCKCKHVEGGLMGDYYEIKVAYIPENKTPIEMFMAGISNPWEELDSL